jgi:hypothetical protein
MTTNTSKDATENATRDAVRIADKTAGENSDESSDESSNNDSDNESDNESAIEYEEEITLSDEFDRLRWSVFKDISNIQVYEDPSKKRTSKLLPFLGHPIAGKSATEPPCHKIALSIEALVYIETPGYKRTGRLVICRADSGIVTIADVVEQLPPYIRANRDEIFWVIGPTMQFDPPISAIEDIPADTELFFAGFSFNVIDEEYHSIGVELDTE